MKKLILVLIILFSTKIYSGVGVAEGGGIRGMLADFDGIEFVGDGGINGGGGAGRMIEHLFDGGDLTGLGGRNYNYLLRDPIYVGDITIDGRGGRDKENDAEELLMHFRTDSIENGFSGGIIGTLSGASAE